MSFYNEEEVILDEFKHLETPPFILESLEKIEETIKSKTYNQFEISFSFRPDAIEFVRESLNSRNKTQKACEMPHFHGYYCTFADMDAVQKDWYFYWRQRTVNRDYIYTDLSYIYVFVYELLNYSFNPNAAFNVSMLYHLYEAYKDMYRLDRLKNIIADMLIEMGEVELANKWNLPYKEDIPKLYEILQEKKGMELSRISIGDWNEYNHNQRKTIYFKSNRNKIYKTFKECIPLLEMMYEEQGHSFLDLYFKPHKVTRRRYLFSGMIVYRENEQNYTFEGEVIRPTEKLFKDMTDYFRMAENVTRLLNNENRQLDMDFQTLPEGLKEGMIAYLKRPKEKGRFKTVKNGYAFEGGSLIPKEQPKVVIEFNDERIKKLQDETENLVEEVEKRANEHEQEEVEEVVFKEEEKNVERASEDNTMSSGLESFFASGSDEIDEEEMMDFIDSLDEIEKEFIMQFNEMEWSKLDASQYLKSKGKMLGVILGSINEKSLESLEDNFLEEDGEELVIPEEFQQVFLHIKGSI